MLISDDPTDLNAPIGLLHLMAAVWRLEVPDDVIEFIARCPTRDPRRLLNTLDAVVAAAAHAATPLDVTFAQHVLRRWLSTSSTTEDVDTIKATTADYYGITLEVLDGMQKSRVATHARHVAMYLCYELTELTLPRIGVAVNGDHITVMYSRRKISSEMKQRPELVEQINELTLRVRERMSGNE